MDGDKRNSSQTFSSLKIWALEIQSWVDCNDEREACSALENIRNNVLTIGLRHFEKSCKFWSVKIMCLINKIN